MTCHRECRWFNPIGYWDDRLVGTCLRDPPPDAYHAIGDGDAEGCTGFERRCDPCPSVVTLRRAPVTPPLRDIRGTG